MTAENRQVAVLIVDSDADARECLRDLLEVEGYSTMSAPQGREAGILLEQATQSKVPCIVLLGHIGKGRHGLEQIAIVDHERFLLEVALSVLNETDRADIEETDFDPRPSLETIEERRLFQQAMCERHPKGTPLTQAKPYMPTQKELETLSA